MQTSISAIDSCAQEKTKCQFCDKLVDFTVYRSRGGQYIGWLSCRNCKYKWSSKMDSEAEVKESLGYGGDAGKIFKYRRGDEVNWYCKRHGHVFHHKGVIVATLAPAVDPNEIFMRFEPDAAGVKPWRKRFMARKDSVKGNVSHYKRYLVREVDASPIYYTPKASTVEKCMGGRVKW